MTRRQVEDLVLIVAAVLVWLLLTIPQLVRAA